MAAPTKQELLDAVNEAILALVSGRVKSYSVMGRTVSYYDLPALKDLRKELQGETSAEDARGTDNLADFEEPI